MNLYHSTMKGLRECRDAHRRQLQQQCSPHPHYKKLRRKTSFFSRFLRRHWLVKSLVLIFVTGVATRRDFEMAIHEHCKQLEFGESHQQAKSAEIVNRPPTEMPLWTWFVPNHDRSRTFDS